MPQNGYFLKLSNRIADAVHEKIEHIVGTPGANEVVYMGADGTPTKMIDDIAEKTILDILSRERRSLRILSEECGERIIGDKPEFTIIIDPIDGTYNASFGIPFYSISLAITTKGPQEVFFGYVKNLATKDVFYAERGKGAYFNSRRIQTSNRLEINKLCISVYGYRPHIKETATLCRNVRRVRVLGSVALELCYVAAGKLDAFVDVRGSLRLTDVAAGKLIVEEAGGKVTDSSGATLELGDCILNKVYMVASNGHVHETILDLSRGDSHEG
ncbi:bifunctional fructose-bisphosphatase/inositol-phosphate phosphatase [Methanolobus halotolerans]|uniref:fructose-bisphosphatase n=1 Tax=Methanolobus halotolerans TaxID=2052935 RepID=A0A4E0PT56_9EURY|nr:bifunctional fructose-bisphosphatase/inositol-phosphate phosphatase [Methanolobus halotolerans]TGC07486.1 D-fructose 1,6-bisphosphatase [Methanolobus halotolerans]